MRPVKTLNSKNTIAISNRIHYNKSVHTWRERSLYGLRNSPRSIEYFFFCKLEKDVFAALFNGYVFDGEPVIYAEDLREVDGRNRLQIRSREEKSTYEVLKKERDLVREVTIGDSTLRLAILGIEHQSEIDYSMVLRTLAYDTLEYLKQEKAIEQKLLPFLGNWSDQCVRR